MYRSTPAALYKGDRDNALAIAMVASRQADPLPLAQAVLTEAAYPPGTRRLFRGHTGGVYSVELSPDGKMALSGSDDATVRLWRIDSLPVLTAWTQANR